MSKLTFLPFMMKRLFVLLFAALVALSACNLLREKEPDGINAKDSLNWAGRYAGVLPCADCEGIKTELTLRSDGTYTLITQFVGKEDNPLEESGSFTWDNTGSRVFLPEDNSRPGEFLVGEEKLHVLDKEGKLIRGRLSHLYVLKKVK
jgi:uncharacterized lipoprotein NlpE involved in copper resistance